MSCIAVVEDEASLRGDLVDYLTACGHRAIACGDGRILNDVMAAHAVEIVILDVNLPGESGFAIAGRLREQSDVGIIMLTARGLGVDRVVGLELGADVYLVKPVELRELEAQIRALIRRLKIEKPAFEPAVPPSLTADTWDFDQLGWMLISPNGERVKLTANERTLVSLLVGQPGEPVSRTDIMSALGKRHWDPADRSVDSMVRRLRAKGERLTGHQLPIEAVHGTGYAFVAPVMTR